MPAGKTYFLFIIHALGRIQDESQGENENTWCTILLKQCKTSKIQCGIDHLIEFPIPVQNKKESEYFCTLLFQFLDKA